MRLAVDRYNHRLVERKQFKQEEGQKSTCLTVLIPKERGRLDLENARLLVLADFFGYLLQQKKAKLYAPNFPEIASLAPHLGLILGEGPISSYDLCLVPRDYLHLAPTFCFSTLRLCGRFFDNSDLNLFLADYGADALRVFFLYQGPPKKDFRLDWPALAGAYRFVKKVWEMSYKGGDDRIQGNQNSEGLSILKKSVESRLQQQKPHTALAAIMGFLGPRAFLTREETKEIATLLIPYTPFLSAQLLSVFYPE